MPIKYYCPKCQRRFTEWGAEKIGFRCPRDAHCPPDQQTSENGESIELLRVGLAEDRPIRSKPTLKKPARRASASVIEPAAAPDEELAPVESTGDYEDSEAADNDVDNELEVMSQSPKAADDSYTTDDDKTSYDEDGDEDEDEGDFEEIDDLDSGDDSAEPEAEVPP